MTTTQTETAEFLYTGRHLPAVAPPARISLEDITTELLQEVDGQGLTVAEFKVALQDRVATANQPTAAA